VLHIVFPNSHFDVYMCILNSRENGVSSLCWQFWVSEIGTLPWLCKET
jgi:hypothetical protein